ncbi:hypothetical protein [Aquicoccus sp. SU-CL01552]|uniref:hypothetical protein n=1 Tax=Aquicoccus sp. SU-CL01552 TaxID=3127656 RepID=UPI00333FEC4F
MEDKIGLIARIERLEAQVARLTEGQADFLTPALRRATGGEWKTAGELWRLAQAEAHAAAATGDPEPELAEALRLEGIQSAHGLGRWLAGREDEGVERGPACRDGVLYLVL